MMAVKQRVKNKMKKNINKEKPTKYMEEIHKKDYKALKKYANDTRAKLQRSKETKMYNIEPEEEKRLIKLGCIDWTEKSKKLYRPEFILTEKGNKYFLELREIWRKDWSLRISIGAFIISAINFILYLKLIGII